MCQWEPRGNFNLFRSYIYNLEVAGLVPHVAHLLNDPCDNGAHDKSNLI